MVNSLISAMSISLLGYEWDNFFKAVRNLIWHQFFATNASDYGDVSHYCCIVFIKKINDSWIIILVQNQFLFNDRTNCQTQRYWKQLKFHLCSVWSVCIEPLIAYPCFTYCSKVVHSPILLSYPASLPIQPTTSMKDKIL